MWEKMNLFVENYRALKETITIRAVSTVRRHPDRRCAPSVAGSWIRSQSLTIAVFSACRACQGWWLPQGSLTQLNETARGAAAPIRLNEPEFL